MSWNVVDARFGGPNLADCFSGRVARSASSSNTSGGGTALRTQTAEFEPALVEAISKHTATL